MYRDIEMYISRIVAVWKCRRIEVWRNSNRFSFLAAELCNVAICVCAYINALHARPVRKSYVARLNGVLESRCAHGRIVLLAVRGIEENSAERLFGSMNQHNFMKSIEKQNVRLTSG